jgi:hypothetical protein
MQEEEAMERRQAAKGVATGRRGRGGGRPGRLAPNRAGRRVKKRRMGNYGGQRPSVSGGMPQAGGIPLKPQMGGGLNPYPQMSMEQMAQSMNVPRFPPGVSPEQGPAMGGALGAGALGGIGPGGLPMEYGGAMGTMGAMNPMNPMGAKQGRPQMGQLPPPAYTGYAY